MYRGIPDERMFPGRTPGFNLCSSARDQKHGLARLLGRAHVEWRATNPELPSMTDPVPQISRFDTALGAEAQARTGERGRRKCIVGRPLSAAAGVAVTGIDLSQPLSPELKGQILKAFCDHHVVVFPDQVLSREQQYIFTANFGEIERHGAQNPHSKRYDVAHV